MNPNPKCAFMSQSHDNDIYKNRVDNCNNGIYLFDNPFANSVHNNTADSFNELCLQVSSDSSTNQITANSVTEGLIMIDHDDA